ncbi:MAG: NAD(P)-dependent oxidoreductase [Pseudomonadota bacterium]
MTQPRIGFIGLGLMGSAMVSRLLDKGYPLTVLANQSRANVDAAIARGAVEVQTAKALATQSEIVMLCMDTSNSVEDRMKGEDGIIAGLARDAVVIDFGTSLPSSTRSLTTEVAQAGGAYLDAPLGRTPAHAFDGLLNIMAAGDKAAYDKVEPVLKDLGENVFHLGASGAGHTVKLLNNFFGMTVANAMCEAFVMADQAGIERQALYDVMSAGPLHSGMMDFVKGYAVDGDPSQLAFAIKNANKDLGYYSEMVKDTGNESIMVQGALTALGNATAEERGDDMVSQMVDFYASYYGKPPA